MAWKPLVWWIGTFFISRFTATGRRDQLTILLQIFNSTIMLLSKCAVGLQNMWVVPVYYRSKVIAQIFMQETFNFTLTKVPFISHWSVILRWNFTVLGGNGCSRDVRVEISATDSVPFSDSWSFWDFGTFEELVVFLIQIFVFLKKINSQFIPVLSRMLLRVFSTRWIYRFGCGLKNYIDLKYFQK